MSNKQDHETYLKISEIVRSKTRPNSVLPFSRSTFLRGVDSGVYPRPLQIPGCKSHYWRLSELLAVLEAANEVPQANGGAA